MAPPRPYWKGYLKLSLVSCPVAVYSAVASGERVAFKQINRQTGHRLKQQLVDEHTGDPVESADKARGYEVGKGDYMLVEDDELEAVAIESQHAIDIDRFVPRAQIDERYLDAPYYHRWNRLLEAGRYGSAAELAAAEKINPSYVSRVFRLTLLAPDIVEAFVEGRQADRIEANVLLKPFSTDSIMQRTTFSASPTL